MKYKNTDIRSKTRGNSKPGKPRRT